MFHLSYSHQSYQKPLWFVPVMLQLFVGRCGRHMPLKSPTDSIGGIKVGKIRAALSATLKPLWKVVRYEPLPKYLKSISSGLLAVWECTPYRRRNAWLVLRSLGRHLRGETTERIGRCWLFAVECRYYTVRNGESCLVKWCLFCYAGFRIVRICKFYFTSNTKKIYRFMATLVPETHIQKMEHLQSRLWIRRIEMTPNSMVMCLAFLFRLWEILVSILAVTHSFVTEDCRDSFCPYRKIPD